MRLQPFLVMHAYIVGTILSNENLFYWKFSPTTTARTLTNSTCI